MLLLIYLIYHMYFSHYFSLQVHQHLPIYTAGIQEFQNRLDRLQIEQAKLAETLANDKR